MNKHNLLGLLGMCRRAGRLVMGFDAVLGLCKEPSVLLIVAQDASPRTVKELRFHVKQHTLHTVPLTKEELSTALGLQKPVAVVATADEGFAKALQPYVTNLTEEESRYDD